MERKNWEKLQFPNGQHPQVTRFAKINIDSQQVIILATDDGLWIMNGFGSEIQRSPC